MTAGIGVVVRDRRARGATRVRSCAASDVYKGQGSSWGVFAIAIPIILPLAESVGVSIPLAIGALVSASTFGSHACFYSDATVLAAQGSGCDVMDHALTQIPYALIAAAISCVGLTVLAAF